MELAFLAPDECESVNLYFQDESRFGLHTRNGRGLTVKGVQPICPFQQVFKSTYLCGAFSPINGERFLLEMPCCNADAFQLFLDEMAQLRPEEFKIVVLDNGAFHKAKKLKIPGSIALLFLPPYSPELNPAEKIWQFFKRKFTNRHFGSLDEISTFFTETVKSLTTEKVISTCSYEYIFLDINWSH